METTTDLSSVKIVSPHRRTLHRCNLKVEIDSLKAHFEKYSKTHDSNKPVAFLGIVGPPKSGKTSLSRLVYDNFISQGLGFENRLRTSFANLTKILGRNEDNDGISIWPEPFQVNSGRDASNSTLVWVMDITSGFNEELVKNLEFFLMMTCSRIAEIRFSTTEIFFPAWQQLRSTSPSLCHNVIYVLREQPLKASGTSVKEVRAVINAREISSSKIFISSVSMKDFPNHSSRLEVHNSSNIDNVIRRISSDSWILDKPLLSGGQVLTLANVVDHFTECCQIINSMSKDFSPIPMEGRGEPVKNHDPHNPKFFASNPIQEGTRSASGISRRILASSKKPSSSDTMDEATPNIIIPQNTPLIRYSHSVAFTKPPLAYSAVDHEDKDDSSSDFGTQISNEDSSDDAITTRISSLSEDYQHQIRTELDSLVNDWTKELIHFDKFVVPNLKNIYSSILQNLKSSYPPNLDERARNKLSELLEERTKPHFDNVQEFFEKIQQFYWHIQDFFKEHLYFGPGTKLKLEHLLSTTRLQFVNTISRAEVAQMFGKASENLSVGIHRHNRLIYEAEMKLMKEVESEIISLYGNSTNMFGIQTPQQLKAIHNHLQNGCSTAVTKIFSDFTKSKKQDRQHLQNKLLATLTESMDRLHVKRRWKLVKLIEIILKCGTEYQDQVSQALETPKKLDDKAIHKIHAKALEQACSSMISEMKKVDEHPTQFHVETLISHIQHLCTAHRIKGSDTIKDIAVNIQLPEVEKAAKTEATSKMPELEKYIQENFQRLVDERLEAWVAHLNTQADIGKVKHIYEEILHPIKGAWPSPKSSDVITEKTQFVKTDLNNIYSIVEAYYEKVKSSFYESNRLFRTKSEFQSFHQSTLDNLLEKVVSQNVHLYVSKGATKLFQIFSAQNTGIQKVEDEIAKKVQDDLVHCYDTHIHKFLGENPNSSPTSVQAFHQKVSEHILTSVELSLLFPNRRSRLPPQFSEKIQQQLQSSYKVVKNENLEKLTRKLSTFNEIIDNHKQEYIKEMEEALEEGASGMEQSELEKRHSGMSQTLREMLRSTIQRNFGQDEPLQVHVTTLTTHMQRLWSAYQEQNEENRKRNNTSSNNRRVFEKNRRTTPFGGFLRSTKPRRSVNDTPDLCLVFQLTHDYIEMGLWKDGRCCSLSDDFNQAWTPALFGTTATQQLVYGSAVRDAEEETLVAKWHIGNHFDTDAREAYTINTNHGKKSVRIEFLLGYILKKSKATAERIYLAENIVNCIISVPHYFMTNQRQNVKDSARVAGFSKVELVNDNSAAAFEVGYFTNLLDSESEYFVVISENSGHIYGGVYQRLLGEKVKKVVLKTYVGDYEDHKEGDQLGNSVIKNFVRKLAPKRWTQEKMQKNAHGVWKKLLDSFQKEHGDSKIDLKVVVNSRDPEWNKALSTIIEKKSFKPILVPDYPLHGAMHLSSLETPIFESLQERRLHNVFQCCLGQPIFVERGEQIQRSTLRAAIKFEKTEFWELGERASCIGVFNTTEPLACVDVEAQFTVEYDGSIALSKVQHWQAETDGTRILERNKRTHYIWTTPSNLNKKEIRDYGAMVEWHFRQSGEELHRRDQEIERMEVNEIERQFKEGESLRCGLIENCEGMLKAVESNDVQIPDILRPSILKRISEALEVGQSSDTSNDRLEKEIRSMTGLYEKYFKK